MKVQFSSTWLAEGGLEGTNGATWNNQQLNEEASFFRAAAASFFQRGERSTRFGFGVTRAFATEADALQFAATHFASLSQQADLHVIDEAGTTSMLLASAVLDDVQITAVIGLVVLVRYSFSGGLFSTESVPTAPTSDTVKRGQVALSVNDESKAVVFSVPFGTTPVTLDCWIVPPSGAPVLFIDAVPLYDTITTAGFTAAIGYPIPATGYYLMWEASGP